MQLFFLSLCNCKSSLLAILIPEVLAIFISFLTINLQKQSWQIMESLCFKIKMGFVSLSSKKLFQCALSQDCGKIPSWQMLDLYCTVYFPYPHVGAFIFVNFLKMEGLFRVFAFDPFSVQFCKTHTISFTHTYTYPFICRGKAKLMCMSPRSASLRAYIHSVLLKYHLLLPKSEFLIKDTEDQNFQQAQFQILFLSLLYEHTPQTRSPTFQLLVKPWV